jgi:hypothetical protein
VLPEVNTYKFDGYITFFFNKEEICIHNLEIGTICLPSETNPKDRADLFSIVSSSRSLEKSVYLKNIYSDSNLPAVLDFPSDFSSFICFIRKL